MADDRTNPALLFDRPLLRQRRARAMRAPADFLQREIAARISERLAEVNRSFTAPAVIGPFAALWAGELGLAGARLVPDDDTLDLAPAAHDLVIHALCLHHANDPVGQMIQANRALRPDGLFIATLFGGRSLTELRQSLAAAETELTGGLSPRVAPMTDIRDAGALLQRAGFALPVADADTLTVTYASAVALCHDLRAMGETNVMLARHRRPLPRAFFGRAAAIYAQAHGDADGRIPATVEVLTLTGWRPGPGQQQPLRPGSARARLADALGTAEEDAGDSVPVPRPPA